MGYYIEEEVWKCSKHPSKKRRSGVCPNCLRDRLVTLCPNCAKVRTCCSCSVNNEPTLRKSRSLAIPLLKSHDTNAKSTKTPSFWWVFRSIKSKRITEAEKKDDGILELEKDDHSKIEGFLRSRSVTVDMTSVPGGDDVKKSSPVRLKGWQLLSPMKVLRQSIKGGPKLVHQEYRC